MIIKQHTQRKGILFISAFLFSLCIVLFSACDRAWEDHYHPENQSIDKLLWDEIQLQDAYSDFVKYISENQLDTLLTNNQQYTLFIPNNEAFSTIPDTVEINDFLLNHLISPNIVSLRNIPSTKKLQTLSGKFAVIEHIEDAYYFDGTEIVAQSPLYLNGRFYEVSSFPLARPNFNEYFRNFLPVIDNYINKQVYDSLDKSMSTPIGFDSLGNTIYDSVFITINPFENRYFSISEESREDFATFVLFSQEQYNAALDEMANTIGGVYQSHKDIPLDLQESILLPTVLKNGIFENILTIEELADPNLLNINGEKVRLDVMAIDPESKYLCSNGALYGFYNFVIPDSLYLGDTKIEGESLIDSIGQGKYAWKEDVNVQGAIVEPTESKSEQASGGSSVVVILGRNFSGEYSVEVTYRNIFPGRHRLEWRANYRPSGIYKIYVNDWPIGEFDTYNLRSTLQSVTGDLFRPSSSGFNSVDFWVENLEEFGDVRVRFEFMDSGRSSDDGFNLDYVSLTPAPN